MDAAAAVTQTVRSNDRDRYLATLYAPAGKRDALFSLYAFNAEIAAIRDRIRDPLPGEIRLQWWRDAIASGDAGGHPVAEALIAAIATHNLPLAAFDNYLDARIFDLYDDPMPSRLDLEGYCGETAGAMLQLSAIVLDAEAAPAHAGLAGRAGCAQAIAGLLRLLPLHRARGQCFIPKDVLSAAGSSPEEFLAGDGGSNAVRAISAMIALAREHLAAFEMGARTLPGTLRPAFLPLALTPLYLEQLAREPGRALASPPDVTEWGRHWRLLRRATRGWSRSG